MVDRIPSRRTQAFTIIELLVVIAIMIVLAGIIVSLTGVTGDKKAISTTRAEIERLSTLIETYKLKTGFYPPDPPANVAEPTNSSLFYELISTTIFGNTFSNLTFGVGITSAQLNTACGVPTVFNSVDSTNAASGDIEDRKVRAYSFIKEVSPRQTNTIVVNGQPLIVFVAPADGPNGGQVNPIHYRIGSPGNGTHNPSTFDLWAVIKTRSGSKTIGNWKD
jgi:type II secretory pathway pseudopilin PulG